MSNRIRIKQRVIKAAEETLHRQRYVSAIDVLVSIGYLQPSRVQDWRKGKVPYLEKVIQANLAKISFIMKSFRNWAAIKSLRPRQTVYLAKTNGPKRTLQFSKSGDERIEAAYCTHYISPLLSKKKQQRLQEKLNKPPELVVFWIISDSECAQCKKELFKRNFLFMEQNQPLCLECAGLSKLVFLQRGDPKLTRRAKKYSEKSIVVVRFSRTRKRYERQGLLVEEEALQKAEAENECGGVRNY